MCITWCMLLWCEANLDGTGNFPRHHVSIWWAGRVDGILFLASKQQCFCLFLAITFTSIIWYCWHTSNIVFFIIFCCDEMLLLLQGIIAHIGPYCTNSHRAKYCLREPRGELNFTVARGTSRTNDCNEPGYLYPMLRCNHLISLLLTCWFFNKHRSHSGMHTFICEILYESPCCIW